MGEVKLIIMCGMPGSGKSTYAEKLSKKENAWIASTDYIRKQLYGDETRNDEPKKIFGRLFYRIGMALDKKKSIIVDATNVTIRDRKKFLQMFKGRYDRSVCVYVATDADECKRRNAGRERVVPDSAIDKFLEKLEVPSKEEGFDEILVIT